MGKRRGRLSRNMCKGLMDMDNMWEVGVGRGE